MKENQFNEISLSLEDTLISSNITSITTELAETSLDQLLDDGLLKNIPIISILVGLGKTAFNIHNRLFAKKIIYFLSQINNIPQKEREEVIKQIDISGKFRIKVGEKLLYIIDKSDDYKSAEIIAKLFAAFLKKEITYSEFLKASTIVNNIFIQDLVRFVENTDDNYSSSIEDISELLNTGLFNLGMNEVDISVSDQEDYKSREKYQTTVDGGTLRADISDIGKIIKKVLKGQLQN